MRSFLRPWATNRYELALAEQVMQKVRGFQSCEAGRKRCPRGHVPARADHAHACRCTEPCRLLTNATRADNAGGLIPQDYGIVSFMIETVTPLVPVAQVEAASEVEKARQHILGHGSPVREPARGGHQNIRAPKIGIQKIARS